MISHEKHQYFYEKYLRNEMPDNERLDFEEKLSADESFRRSFEHYKRYRKVYLDKLLVEDKEDAKKKWTLNSWLYLLVSLTGLALAVNYFLFKDDEIHSGRLKPDYSWNIFNKIPFLGHRGEPQKKYAVHKTAKYYDELKNDEILKDTSTDTETKSGRNYSESENSTVANDILELDSFIVTYEKEYFELRFKTIKNQTDSIIADSLVQNLAAKSSARNAQQSKPVMIFVEFWKSPVNFRGYKFNGKKLVLYGIPSPYEIYLLRSEDDFIIRTPKNEFELTRDNNYHKF